MSLIDYKTEDRIAYLTLNRPEKRNALNHQMVNQLKEAFVKAENDNQVKVVVLKSTGKVFSAGADLQYIQQLQRNTYEENLADSNHLKELFQTIYLHKKVVIAQVHGHAIAGGCGLATVCDFVFSQPEAKFGYTEVHIGFVPALVMVYLLRRLGEGSAKELLLSGELIDAVTAERLGLVNQVVPLENLGAEVQNFARKLILENSGQSMQRTKGMIAKVQSMSLDEALDYAADQNAKARSTSDCQTGIKAFLDKKTHQW